MCLGIPGRITAWIERDPLTAAAEVDFGGLRRVCQMACVPDAEAGQYVLVHAGVALTVIDPDAAERLLETLRDLGDEAPVP